MYITVTYNLETDKDFICQCGCIVNRYCMKKNLKTAKHELMMNVKWSDVKILKQFNIIKTSPDK